jgi:hypothetical protein
VILRLFVILLAAAGACGCGASQAMPTATRAEEAALFGSQLNMCVQTASDRAMADRCRASVELYWCGKGGALNGMSGCNAPQDGGQR